MGNQLERRFVYVGPDPDDRKQVIGATAALSAGNFHLIVEQALSIGRYQLTAPFKKRSRERSFDFLDVENAIRAGAVQGNPIYCPTFSNWKGRIIGPVEDKRLEVVVALDESEDYDESPLIIPVTGCWRE